MATIRPFKALRYDEDIAGPLASLVAPPYDVISETERAAYLARSSHNVVHLTLPDSEEQAARDLAAWRESGVLVEDEPSYWWLSQDYAARTALHAAVRALSRRSVRNPMKNGSSSRTSARMPGRRRGACGS